MAKVCIVPPEHWSILKQYVGADAEGVVLIPEEVIPELHEKHQAVVRDYDGRIVEYGFGGSCDVQVDVILTSDSYAATDLFGDVEDDE